MKKLYALLLSLAFSVACLHGQTDRIAELEKSLPQQKGEQYVSDALTLSGLYFEQGFFHKAAERAENAYDAAKKLNLREQMASALNKGAKALLKVPNSRPAVKNKAFKNLQESNKLTTDLNLRLDNLRQMKELAILLDRKKDLQKITEDIAVLTGEVSPNAPGGTVAQAVESERKRTGEIVSQVLEIKEENMALSAELQKEREKIKKNHAFNQKRQQALEIRMASMSEAQIKSELVISETKRIVDSLAATNLIASMEIAKKQANLEKSEMALREKDAIIKLQNSQRNLLLVAVGFIVLMAGGLFHRNLVTKRHNAVLAEKNKIIEEERKRSEDLLLNILPMAVATELKQKNAVVARHYKNATVLFTDFQGFSKISQILSPEQLVNDLDYAFKNFDRIIGKHGLEKIKTIGDAYMCAGGLPAEDGSHPKNVVRAALEIQQFLKGWNAEKVRNGEPAFEARIGIHTGPLVAGVVGSKKFAYDIWGDTVNIAARMESNSEVGKVNISASTFAFVENDFDCLPRGKVPAKNVGEVEMYFVEEERV